MLFHHNFKTKEHLHYYIFQCLFIAGILFDETVDWHSPFYSVFSILSLLGATLFPKTAKYIFFTVLSFFIFETLKAYPILSNHKNLILFLSILILPFQALYISKEENKDDDKNLKLLINVIRITTLILYFFTFFHKLNSAFLTHRISCANFVIIKYLELLPVSIANKFILINPYLALLVEGLIPLFFFFKNTRVLALIIASLLHFILAPVGFTNFSSFAFALIWCFVASENLNTGKLLKHFRFFSIAILSIVIGFSIDRIFSLRGIYIVPEAILFILIYAPFVWLHFFPNMSKEKISFLKAPLYNSFLILFIIHGASNYLGLRTAGNLTMFSNIKTEGERSNHLLLRSNPIKIFNYQEDTVEILEFSPFIKSIHRSMPDINQKIPRVEFSRLLDIIAERVPAKAYIKYKYKNKVYESSNAGFDKSIQVKTSWLEKKLLYFRHIQTEGAQECHW